MDTYFKERPFFYPIKLLKHSTTSLMRVGTYFRGDKRVFCCEDAYSITTYNNLRETINHFKYNEAINQQIANSGRL